MKPKEIGRMGIAMVLIALSVSHVNALAAQPGTKVIIGDVFCIAEKDGWTTALHAAEDFLTSGPLRAPATVPITEKRRRHCLSICHKMVNDLARHGQVHTEE